MLSIESLVQCGVLILGEVSQDGVLLDASDALLSMLGRERCELGTIEPPFSDQSLSQLRHIFDASPVGERTRVIELTFVQRNGNLLEALVSGLLLRRDARTKSLQLVVLPMGDLGRRIDELRSANEVMSQMLQSAKVAYWCIEFAEAVDITVSIDEVVRQVFENRSYWRMCNRAMADVYEMPSDFDFGQQPVRLYWPRSPANEEFVRRLVLTDFCVDGALSVDRRHDGSPAYVENDVRACIENGRLLRMWGSIRDVSQSLRYQHDADNRIDALRRVFDEVPDAVIVVDEARQPQWRNAAFEHEFGITRAPTVVDAIMDRSLSDRTWRRLELVVQEGRCLPFDVHCSRVLMREGVAWWVAVLRSSQGASGRELHP